MPIYPSNTPPECCYILQNSESKFVFAENIDQYNKLKAEEANLDLEKIILFDGSIPLAIKVATVSLILFLNSFGSCFTVMACKSTTQNTHLF